MRNQAAIIRLTLALGLATVMAACGTSGDAAQPPAAPADSTPSSDTVETDGETAADNTSDDTSEDEASGTQESAQTSAQSSDLSPTSSRTVELGVQVADDSGVVVTLERLVIEPTFVVVELSAANGSTDKVALAADNETGIELLTDDPSSVFSYRAPSRNESLELSSGEVLEGEIVFLGILGAAASSFDLTFNPEPDPTDPEPRQPTITFVDIPIDPAGS